MEQWMHDATAEDLLADLPKSATKRTLADAFGAEITFNASKKHCPSIEVSLSVPNDVPSLDDDSSNYASAEGDLIMDELEGSEERTVSSILASFVEPGNRLEESSLTSNTLSKKSSESSASLVPDSTNRLSDHTLWQWRTTRSLKFLSTENHWATYFDCTNARKDGCPAKKKEIRMLEEDEEPTKVEIYGGEHTHEPPTKRPPMARVKKFIKEALRHQRTAANIEHEVLSSSNFSDAEKASMPSTKQINQQKSHLSRKNLPCGDSLMNLMVMHKDFVLKLELHPSVRIVLAAADGLDLLRNKNFSNIIMVDGTFNIAEGSLVLTTVLLSIDGVHIPAAFMLSNSQTADDYAYFFRTLSERTNNLFAPSFALCDYEIAMHNGLKRAFPTISVYGDSFHFVQANRRWLVSRGCHNLCDNLTEQLRTLWSAKSRDQFNKNYKFFEDHWLSKNKLYCQYFEQTWVKTFIPEMWSRFGRNEELPSGDQAIEGWHNRFQNQIKSTSKELAIDVAVDLLFKEFQALHLKFQSTRQLVQSTSRVTLTNIMTPPAPVAPNVNINQRKCGCNRSKANAQCLFRYCKSCCILKNVECGVASHDTAKCLKYKADIITLLDRAMKEQTVVWIKYGAGSRPNTIRAVTPAAWTTKDAMINYYCDSIKDLKKLKVIRMIEVRDRQWSEGDDE